jgi:hypothetical protein
MAIHPAVFVPPLVVAHLLGLVLLGYSLEKVFGVFSKLLRRLRPGSLRHKATGQALGNLPALRQNLEAEEARSDAKAGCFDADWESSLEARSLAGLTKAPQFRVVSQPWTRGCDCEVCLLCPVASHIVTTS